MQIPDSAHRLVNCQYKAAAEGIIASLVKANTVVWATNEMHSFGSAGIVSETGHDYLFAEIN